MEEKIIDLKKIFQILWEKRKVFYWVWGVTFILACIWIFPKPRYYSAKVLMAPEAESGNLSGGLGALAVSLGVDINSSAVDAFNPEMYPDIISSNEFIVGLFDIPVSTIDSAIHTDYYTYIRKHQKAAFYSKAYYRTKIAIQGLFTPKEQFSKSKKVNPFHMTKKEKDNVDLVNSHIKCIVDKGTGCFIIKVKDQDPLIAATMADSVCQHLQDYITDYRTNKARKDMVYYSKLMKESYAEYQEAAIAYTNYVDNHQKTISQKAAENQSILQTEMDQKLSIYQKMSMQYENARAKVQAQTPVFTILQGASVPIKPSQPKRLFFVAIMLILSTLVLTTYLLRKELAQVIAYMAN